MYPVTSLGCWAVAIEGLRFGPPCRTAAQRRFGAVKADGLGCLRATLRGKIVWDCFRSGAAGAVHAK